MALTDGLREYMARDWAAVRESKETALAERLDRLGPAESLRMADDVRAADRAAHPLPGALLRRTSPF